MRNCYEIKNLNGHKRLKTGLCKIYFILFSFNFRVKSSFIVNIYFQLHECKLKCNGWTNLQYSRHDKSKFIVVLPVISIKEYSPGTVL